MADQPRQSLTGAPLFLAIGVVLVWLAAVIWLATQTSATEIVWARLTFLLGSIEAVAFGAAGAVFGTQIQRQRVDAAEARAGKAEQDAHDKKQEAIESRREANAHREAAENGRVLAGAVKAEAGRVVTDRQRGTRSAADDVPQSIRPVSLQIADKLFPEV